MEISVNKHFLSYVTDWDSEIYFLVGGYGSSKSYHTALKILLKLATEKRTALVVREVYETIRESCYSLFGEIAGRLNLPVIFLRSPLEINFPNGSRIIFRGLDKVEKLRSINDVSLIWVEECAEIKYSGYKELLGRLRHPTLPMYILLSTNPVAKSNWTYKHFFKDVSDAELYEKRAMRVGEIFYHHSTCDDNFFLPKDYRRRLDEMKSYDADLYRVGRLGRFGVNGRRVLPQFEVGDVEAAKNIPKRFHFTGMDFGFEESYNAVIRCAVDDERKWLYIYWEYYRRQMTDDETADELERLGLKESREVIRCDSAEPKAIRYLQKRGFNAVACKKWNGGTRHARLDNTKKIKRFKKIICAAECRNAIKELGELTYSTDKDGNLLEDEFNIDAHTLSAIWYALDSYDLAGMKLARSDFGF